MPSTKSILLSLSIVTLNVANAAAQVAWPNSNGIGTGSTSNSTESPEQVRDGRIVLGSVLGAGALLGAAVGACAWWRNRAVANAESPGETTSLIAVPRATV